MKTLAFIVAGAAFLTPVVVLAVYSWVAAEVDRATEDFLSTIQEEDAFYV